MHDMRKKTVSLMLLVIAFIHIVPVVGFLGAERLESLYGVAIASPDLEILMRHRAVLFGILGCLFARAAFKPDYQPLAFIAAAATLLPFFYLVFGAENPNEALQGLVRADLIALGCLCIATILFYLPIKDSQHGTAESAA